MADVRIAWLGLFTVCAVAVTACAATTSTSPEPTPAASTVTIMPKGDLPLVQAPTTATTTPPPAPPPGVPVTTSPPAPPPGVPVTTSPPALTPLDPGLVIDATALRLPRPGKTTSTPTPVRPTCTPGVTPAPLIRDVYPNKGDIKGGTDILISGTNLDLGPGTMVSFGNTSIAPWSLSSSTLSVIAPPGAAGPITLTLSHPGGCRATAQFTYVDPSARPTTAPPTTTPPTAPAINGPCPGGSAPPTITGILPRQLTTTGGQLVEIFGRGFAPATGQIAVVIGSTQVTPISVSATRIQVTSPPGAAGPFTIKVAVPLGCTTYSAGDVKYVVPKPVIASVTPTQAPKAGGTSIVIAGQNLANATVKVASTSATITANTDTSITIVLPAARFAGNAAMTVSTPGGSTGLLFKYTP